MAGSKSVGSLWAMLGLDDKKFVRGIKNSQRTLKQFGRGVSSIGRSIHAGIVGPLTALAGVAGFGMIVRDSLKAADEVGKLSDRLNMSTEALTGLQHAAKLTGTDYEVMNRALEKMTINLGKATRASGAQKDALEKMGIDIDKIKKLEAGEQFKRIADGIQGLGTQVERAAAASDIFGRSGARMLNLLILGSENIRKIEKEAQDLGLTFTRIEAKGVEEANDNLIRMRRLVTAVGNRIAVFLAPYISEISTRLIEAANSGSTFKAKVTSAIEVSLRGLARLKDVVLSISIGFNLMKLGFQAIELIVVSGVEKIIQTFFGLKGLFEHTFSVLNALVIESSATMKLKFKEAFNYIAGRLDKLTDNKFFKFYKMNTSIGFDEESIQKSIDDVEKAKGMVTEAGKNMGKAFLNGFQDPNSKTLAFFNIWQDEVEDAAAETSATITEAMRQMGDDSDIDMFMLKLKKIKEKWDKVSAAQIKAMEKLQESGEDVLAKKLPAYADKFEKSLSGVFKKLLKEGKYTLDALKAGVGDLILDQIFGAASNRFASTVVGYVSNLPNMFGSKGSRPTSNLLPSVAGVGAGGYGTPTIVQQMHFGEGVNAAARAAVTSSMPAIANATKNAYTDEMKRRGR